MSAFLWTNDYHHYYKQTSSRKQKYLAKIKSGNCVILPDKNSDYKIVARPEEINYLIEIPHDSNVETIPPEPCVTLCKKVKEKKKRK